LAEIALGARKLPVGWPLELGPKTPELPSPEELGVYAMIPGTPMFSSVLVVASQRAPPNSVAPGCVGEGTSVGTAYPGAKKAGETPVAEFPIANRVGPLRIEVAR
jgi:hypothetical protein